VTSTVRIEDLLRELAPQVLGAVVRRSGDFDAAEDAMQEALLAAAAYYRAAAARTTSEPERQYLITHAARLNKRNR
jgi:predicted RNA polymerase sigma factor